MLKKEVKGQVSLEYLLITGFAFLFIAPLIAVFYSQSQSLNEDVQKSQAERVASAITEAANQVYYLGEPSKKSLLVYMPQGVESVTINQNYVSFKLSSLAGSYEVVKWSDANLTGSIATFAGLHKVEVKATSLGVEIKG